MLDKLRARLDPYLTLLGRSASGISPTGWTFLGLISAFAAGLAYSPAWLHSSLLGGALVIISGFFDVIDGSVARVTGKTSKKGAFLDSTLDRLAEVALYTGIFTSGFAEGLTALLALSLSLLVSYTRAKGDSLGVSLAGIGIGERSERLLIIAVSSILGLLYYGVIAVVILASYTFAERVYIASSRLP